MREMSNLLEYLESVIDLRQAGKVKHLMKDIIALVFFATLANASGWEDIYYFAVMNEKIL